MHYVLAAVLCFGILTLWVPGYWPVAVFEICVYGLASWAVLFRRPRFTYPLAALTFALGWIVLQLLTGWTVSGFETRIEMAHWAALLASFVAGAAMFQDADKRRWFRSAMLWFGFVVAAVATLQTFTAGGKVFWIFDTEYSWAVMGPFLSPNHYAAFMELLLPLAIFGALRRRHDTWLCAAMAVTMYASIIASSSRAGVILASAEFVVAGVLLAVQRRTSGRVIVRSLWRVAALLVVFTVVVGWGTIWARLQNPDPFANRRDFAVSTCHMIAGHPWTGTGVGTWPIIYPQYALVDTGKFANRAHNDWLEWTAGGGIPFGAALLSLFLWSIRPAFRSVWGIGVVAVFLHATVDYPFSRPALAAWIVVMLAMLAAEDKPARPNATAGLQASSYR